MNGAATLRINLCHSVLTACALAFLPGCSDRELPWYVRDTTVYAAGYSDTAFSKIVKGMTTNDVVALIGLPLTIDEYGDTFMSRTEVASGSTTTHRCPPSPASVARERIWHYSRSSCGDSFSIRIVYFSVSNTCVRAERDAYID